MKLIVICRLFLSAILFAVYLLPPSKHPELGWWALVNSLLLVGGIYQVVLAVLEAKDK